jgi:hypothetical protein
MLGRRFDTTGPAINKARHEMTAAVHELAASVGPLKDHMGEIAEQTKKTSVQNIQSYTKYAAALLLEAQTKAMTASARAMFDNEVGPPLRRLTSNLERLAKHIADRGGRTGSPMERPRWPPRSGRQCLFCTSCTANVHWRTLLAGFEPWAALPRDRPLTA